MSHHFERRGGALFCEEVSLAAIADAVGTPVYVYSSATLERHYQVFVEAFAPLRPLVAFAVKANGNLAVLRTLARQGCGADTVSAGEIERALAAGVAPERIIFAGVGKTAEELAYALDQRVHQINVESPAELRLLGEIAAARGAHAPLAIRINPDIGAGGHAKINTGGRAAKFGVSVEDALALYAEAAAHPHLEPLGLAVHIGSQIQDFAPLEAAFGMLRGAAEALRRQGLPVRRLDLGGGLAAPYYDAPDPPPPSAYAALVKRVMAGFEVELAFEPGRLIAANAGVLVTRVIREQARADRRIVILDAAMNDLIRPAMYDAYHAIVPVGPARGPDNLADFAGPVCETGDTFARDRPAPPLQEGDLAAILSAGAYGAVMASSYNARALVPEVLVRGHQFAVVRRRLSVAEQMALEPLPAWLANSPQSAG